MNSIPAPLKGKVSLVTGGSRGIGRAIAETFARHGCTHIAITYNTSKTSADTTLSNIAAINSSIKTYAFAADVCESNSGTEIVKQALSGLGIDRLDIMVSCATLLDGKAFGTIADITKEQWDRMMTATAWTPFLLARESSKVMPKGGRIIFISSAASKTGTGDPVMSYSVGKAALDSVSRNLAAKYGVDNGVTVNSISVGATLTDTFNSTMEEFGDDVRAYAESLSLLKRVGQPQEVANVVAFVASPEASWIIGNNVPANGGCLIPLQG